LPGSILIISIIAHYIVEDGTLELSTLVMREVIREHSRENFTVVVLEVLEQWDIISKVDSKLGWFQADNASNNDTMIRKISHDLH
jgi:hypothetical protein